MVRTSFLAKADGRRRQQQKIEPELPVYGEYNLTDYGNAERFAKHQRIYFIATAMFGSPFDPNVNVLRKFRDHFLLVNSLGRTFVETYYLYSPPIVRFIANHDILRALLRWSLTPMIGISWMALNFGLIPSIFFILLMLIFINISVVVLFRRIWMGTHMD